MKFQLNYVSSIVLVLFFNSFYVIAQQRQESICLSEEDTLNNSYGIRSLSCSGDNLESNIDRYKFQENFTPYMGNPVKIIKINFHSIQNGTTPGNKGNFEDTPLERAYMDSVVEWMNYYFSNLSQPLNPKTCFCGNECYIPDTRYRVELQNKYFHYAPQDYDDSNKTSS